jgi:aldehyde:ferredoxin oxidoreductase
MVGDGQAGGSIGPMIKRAGYDAIVIRGAAEKPSYLLVDGDNVTIEDADSLTGKTVSQVNQDLGEKLGKKDLSIIQCGPAGENLVRWASLMVDSCDAVGRCGLGAVFGSKNLRAVAVCGGSPVEFADPAIMKDLGKLAGKRLPGSGFPETLKKYGTPGIVNAQAEGGNFATRNFTSGAIADYAKLDGSSYDSSMDGGSSTCFACIVGCRKRVKADKPFAVTDSLGGPEFETLGLLGANCDIADPVAVARANELCNDFGLDTITTGAVAAYIFECMEKGLIKPDQVDGQNLRYGDPESLFWIIEAAASRKGIGNTLADGFPAMITAFGEETRPSAVNVKGAGLPAHMPQVKPSQALMYSVCPIGPDHMSSEHDWLLASGAEVGKALGISGQEDTDSTSLNKVRMTAYTGIYYSLMDTLCLCMFVWGPGSLYTYRDLEDLIAGATGWNPTFWELMKIGERRITMMRQVNARRGFTRKDDILPERLFEPLLDGPSKGKHVDREAHERMKEDYYGLMGWDPGTGNPTRGKLIELGLDWAI